MKVCIPVVFKPEGGGQYFLEHWRRFLETHGHATTRSVEDAYDVLFTNHWVVPVRDVLKGMRHNPDVRVIQRIDGAAADYGRTGNADRRQRAVNRLADLTIFQSAYCRWSTREKFPVIGQDGPVIHNPVDLERFTPDGERFDVPDPLRSIVSVSWSTNPRKGARTVYAVAAAHPDLTFHLCGRFPDAPDLPNVRNLGVLDRDRLPAVLRSCAALLTFSENEACPNHVLEALASGLPVLYHDSGATAEVTGPCGLPVTPDTFRAQWNVLQPDLAGWKRRSRDRAVACFNPAAIFPRYLDEIARARARPPRMPAGARRLWPLGGRASEWWLQR